MHKNTEWVELFRTFERLYLPDEGDDLADTFVLSGFVLLGTAAMRSQDPIALAASIKLPVKFVAAVHHLADRVSLWDHESFDQLIRLLIERPFDRHLIEDTISWVLDELWLASPLPPFGDRLGQLRHGVVPGGAQRQYPPVE